MNLINSYRGPDFTGTYTDNFVSLGHNLLSIANYTEQPLISNKDNVLLFNGEIYGVSDDTNFLSNNLDFYGIDYLKNVDGHFSIVWYEKNKNEITLVRDHFGTRPLFYIHNNNGLAFSSSIEALVKLVKSDFDYSYDQKITSNNKLTKFLKATTYYKDIKKVLPGQYLKFNVITNKLINKGWLFDFDLTTQNISDHNIKKLIEESIYKVSYNNKKTALLLSGGLDSNVILSKLPIETFTVTTGKPGDIELEQASKSSLFYKVKNYQEIIDKNKYEDTKDHIVKTLYTPIWDYSRLVPKYIGFECCYKNHAKVVITGDGGDEIFTGYEKDAMYLDKSNWIEKNELIDSMSDYFDEFPVDVLGDDCVNNIKFAALITNDYNNFTNDAFAGKFSMEVRSPFLLQSLVKVLMSVSSERKLQFINNDIPEGIGKYFLRKLFEKELPPTVVQKNKKTGWNIDYNNDSIEEFFDMSRRLRILKDD